MDKTLYHNEIMESFTMTRHDNALSDAYSKKRFVLYYCGFDAELAEPDILSEQSKAILASMPTYPNDDSIIILDGAVVIKLSE